MTAAPNKMSEQNGSSDIGHGIDASCSPSPDSEASTQDKRNESSPDTLKQLRGGLLLLLSFAVFNLGYIVDQTIRWSHPLHGLINGVFHILAHGMIWCLFFLPWSLGVIALYRWRKWKRFRTHWVLAPAVLVLLTSIGDLILHPQTASKRFKNSAKTELPSNAQNLHFHFSGGGLADYSDTYYFETTPEEVDRLIAEMKLSEDENYGIEGLFYTPISPLEKYPDFSTWKDAQQYTGLDDKKHWFYHLITDTSRTKVYIMVGCL